eukprot:CAMPEP_0169192908 /NCGR_PEP_ID=MMETSP1016-20121227/5882_1 /TAXON_ID=342587 /ORGANISM="Karlodinium micrum, Strain CCMP2283" /LENGTH=355 /DNA_ID=CAMNT_0009269313 /DNA_START=9 /DNA_END=1076 /DNA_ORIENTATION=-
MGNCVAGLFGSGTQVTADLAAEQIPGQAQSLLSCEKLPNVDITLGLAKATRESFSSTVKANKIFHPAVSSSLLSPRMLGKENRAHAQACRTQANQIFSTSIKPQLRSALCSPRDGNKSLVVAEGRTASVAVTASLLIEDLLMSRNVFNAHDPRLKAQLLEKLGLPCGLVLKLVPHHHEKRKTDREKYIELLKRCPRIVSDPSITVPIKIFQLSGPDGAKRKDLIVMRQASGMQITQHLYYKFHGGGERIGELLNIFKCFGRFLRDIHQVYRIGGKSMQHGDCQPSNIFFDDNSGSFTLIDVADFGVGLYLGSGRDDDVERFIAALVSLKVCYSQSLIDACVNEFRAGYGTLCKTV